MAWFTLIKRFTHQEVVKPSSGQHWDFLDGLRGLAILMVVACHGFYANPNGPKALKVVGDFIGAGAIGVQMFFVLSGFLIAYPLLKAKSETSSSWYVAGYTIRRCLKIFPPFILCILLLCLVYRFEDGTFERTWTGLLWLVGVPHLVYVPEAPLFNGSFWSLWVEIGFYIVLPLCFFILRGLASVTASAFVIALTLFVASMLASFLTWPSESRPSGFMLFIFGRFPNSLSNFSFGILFAGLFISWRKKRGGQTLTRLAPLGYIGLIFLFSSLLWQTWVIQQGLISHWYTYAIKQLLVDVATFLLMFFIFDSRTWGNRMFSWRWLKYLGVISYEWFLLHQPFFDLSRKWSGGSDGSFIKYLFIILTPMILTLIAAILIYHFFSAPIIEWGRRRIAAKAGRKLQPSRN